MNKKPSPRLSGRGPLQSERVLFVPVVVSVTSGCRVVKFARGSNRALAGIWLLKPGRLVPVQMVDGVRVFGVGLGQFAVKDLRLLLEPTCPQGLDLSAVVWVGFVRSNALVQRDPVPHVRPRVEVLLGRIVDES